MRAFLVALDRSDCVLALGLLLLGIGLTQWSGALSAVVVGGILLALAWPPAARKGP